MACPQPKRITATVRAKCNVNERRTWGEVGENFWALAVHHCSDTAREKDCVVMMVDEFNEMREKLDDRTNCIYEFSATVHCGKKPRSTWEIIFDAIAKGTGLTAVVVAAFIFVIPEPIAQDVEALKRVAQVIDGFKRAAEVAAH